jgi:hypothetical protein
VSVNLRLHPFEERVELLIDFKKRVFLRDGCSEGSRTEGGADANQQGHDKWSRFDLPAYPPQRRRLSRTMMTALH